MDLDDFVKRVEDMKTSDKLETNMKRIAQLSVTNKLFVYFLEDTKFPAYMEWIRGNKRIYFSEKLERLIPTEYPTSIPNSWDVLRKNLQRAKMLGPFDRYKIKYSTSN